MDLSNYYLGQIIEEVFNMVRCEYVVLVMRTVALGGVDLDRFLTGDYGKESYTLLSFDEDEYDLAYDLFQQFGCEVGYQYIDGKGIYQYVELIKIRGKGKADLLDAKYPGPNDRRLLVM